jgi:hypothetical protein
MPWSQGPTYHGLEILQKKKKNEITAIGITCKGKKFFSKTQTGFGAHPTSCSVGTRLLALG